MPNVSIFKNVLDPKHPVYEDLITVLEKTRDGEWEDIVMQCRCITDKDERDLFKQNMPTIAFSGEFSYRKDSDLIEHTGIISMDLDHVEDILEVRKKLHQDKYVYACFVSTSGYGLRVMFMINPAKHRESFAGISQYLFEMYGQVCDPNGVNVSKPYCVSFDPYLFLNPNTVPVFNKFVKETIVKQIPDFVYTPTDFEEVLKQITGRGINICESYDDWLKVGFALAEQFGDNGEGFFHDISRQSSKYSAKVTALQYKYCMKARGTKKANISTFYYFAKLNGVNIVSEKTKTIVRATKNGKKVGLTKQQIIDNLLKLSNIGDADKVVDSIFDNQGSDEYGDTEESVLYQLEMFISNNYNLKMNEVTGYLEHNGTQLSATYINSVFIAAKKLLPKIDYPLMMKLLKSDFIESYNPFYKFFNSDGMPVTLPSNPDKNNNSGYESPLIDKLSDSIENDNPSYTRYFLRKWIVSIVSSAHKVHSPLLLALMGAQNTGKTEFFRRLFPPELGNYYAESKLDKEKDDELLMTENLLIMDDELGGKSKQESKKLNSITSKQYFSIRRPYGDHNEKILRLAVLGGTSNYEELFSDPTGNRRIIPITVLDINKELYNSIDKSDLFREAFRLYKDGFDWRITVHDIKYLNIDSNKYETVIKEREIVEKYFEPCLDDVKLSTTEILIEIEYLTQQKVSINALGAELKRCGFEKVGVRINSALVVRKWGVKRINRFDNNQFGSTKSKDLPF